MIICKQLQEVIKKIETNSQSDVTYHKTNIGDAFIKMNAELCGEDYTLVLKLIKDEFTKFTKLLEYMNICIQQCALCTHA